VSPGGQNCTTPDGSTLTCAITGLTNGATYTITVAAINVGGPGLNSDASAPVVANAELPVNTATPAVSGTTTVGQQLSSTTGSWDSDPTATYAYEWQRCAAVDCASPTVVGSDSSNYTLVAADYGNYIRVKVTATNSGGSASAYSSATAQVAGTAPVNSVAPAVSGTPTVRSSVSVTTGTWSGTPTPTYSYQWRTCTTPDCSGGTVTNVDGATSSSYTIQNAQYALYLQAVVTATNAISPSGVTQASSVTAVVARPSQTFGEDGTYTVPSGVTAVSVTVAGAGGGNYVANTGNATGGSGASVSGTLSVTPGDTLTIQTGGLGGNNSGNTGGAGGTRGGGAGANGLWTLQGAQAGGSAGGGGYSRILSGSTTLVVAGGGSGAGWSKNGTSAGANANGDGTNGTQTSSANSCGKRGNAGTSSAGGNGGAGGTGGTAGSPGTAGASLTGGAGGSSSNSNSNAGSGGGAGYFGGGGGGGNSNGCSGATGGSGSSYVNSSFVTASAITTAATRAAGSVTIAVTYLPEAPTGASALPLNASASVNWTAPTNNGGAAISGYRIDRATGPTFVDWSTINANTGTTATSCSSTGLTNDTSYKYRIYALNGNGTSTSYAETNAATPSASLFISTWETTDTVTLPLADGTFGGVTNDYDFTV
jgi:hypothetical protein